MSTVARRSRSKPAIPLAFKVLGWVLMLGSALFFAQVLILGFSFTFPHNVLNIVFKGAVLVAGYGFLRMKRWAVPLYFVGVAAAMLRMFLWPPTPELGELYATPSGVGLALVMPAIVGVFVVAHWERFTRDVG